MPSHDPHGSESGRRRYVLLLVLTAALAALHAWSYAGAGPLDDDFILYRFARHLVAGDGLVYNLGRRVEGFTSPLWVFVLASGMALGFEPWSVSFGVSIAASAAAALAIGAVWRARVPDARWPIPALLVAMSPALAFHAAGGLGTALLAALLAVWFWRYDAAVRAQRPAWGAAVWLGVATLVRQEALLFAICFLLAERRRGRLASAWPAWLPAVAWTAFRGFYFGRLLPLTYYAKRLPVAVDLGYGWRYLLESTWTAGTGVLFALVALGLCARRGAPQAADAPSSHGTPPGDPARRAASFGFLAHTLYVVWVGGDYMALARFFVPTLPLGFALACLAVRERMEARRAGAAARDGAPLVAGACLGLAFLLTQVAGVERTTLTELHAFHEERWEDIGRVLAKVCEPGTSVAVSAIGAVGYHSELEIVDMLGLTSEAVAAAEPDLAVAMKGHHRYDADWVLSMAPDIVILGLGQFAPGTRMIPVYVWERSLLEHAEFRTRYRRHQLAMPRGDDLILFVREDARRPLGAWPMDR